MSEAVRRPLVLDSPEFTARAGHFASLMSAGDFQERFFRDPAAVAAEEFGLCVDTATLSRANRLTYALLADPDFATWAADFQARVPATLASGAEGVPSLAALQAAKAQLVREFIDSVQAHLDPATVATVQDLDPGTAVAEGDAAVAPTAFIVIIVIIVVVVVVAGVGQADGALSRKTLQLVIRQLDEQQAAQIAAGRELNA
ncbi:hypothetical protein OG883_15245 [Streptomyces sp. NBC_01142]|uniref:hypothetical protein n=1 Tax=Streptomyces sp. NBC_01142 TaxID=2975865 RepID=UPI00224F10D9|nr:hypothetical protein [Streptomyces sp. NBC_01142]MCX4821242.1 hypothetical protein [Streptomyces sp. NBC_01142]